MTNFEEIKSQWSEQSELKTPENGSKQIAERVNSIKQKQLIANIVLGATLVVLVVFFFYVKAFTNLRAASALVLMIGALLIRIIIEHLSSRKLKKVDVTTDSTTFKHNIKDYYKKRINIHHIITPIIAVLYITGFVMLLPIFKVELSSGFYMYVKVSGILIFVVLAIYIRKEILKEIKLLKDLGA